MENDEELSPLERAGEVAAFGLRMTAGWPFVVFRDVTGFDLREVWGTELNELEEQGWGRIEGDRFRLTSTGLRFADAQHPLTCLSHASFKKA